ncbi:MAG: secretin N-terminal domain-containing protein [Planctomycetota bacterium]
MACHPQEQGRIASTVSFHHPTPRRIARVIRGAALIALACGAPSLHAQESLAQPAVVRPASEQIIRVSKGERVTVHVADLPIAEAMRMLSEPSKRNIILADGVKGTVTASMYGVDFDSALKAMLVSNSLGYRQDGDFIFVYPQEEMAKFAASSRKITTRVFKLNFVNAAAVKPLIDILLSPAGKAAITPPSSKGLGSSGSGGSSGGSSSSSTLTTEGDALASPDTLIVTDYEDRIEQVDKVIRDLDKRPKQVLIEATLLRATLNEDNALGIDFTTVGGVDFAALSSVSPGAQNIQTGNIPTANLQNTNYTFRNDLNAALPGGGFTFGILKDQVGVFLRALEQITDTDVIANPKILALNKQVGQVLVGRRDGYLTTTITETTAIQKVEFLETGTVLSFRPFINDDGTVRMEIHPKDSTGGLTEANLPFEQTTEVTSNIIVKDGHTVLIGGLFREVSTSTRGQVPLLGNIPGVGALFRRTRDATTREEVIVLLTIHVIKGDDDNEASLALREDIERFRVGMRHGLQWFGRERLAEAHYRWAVEHFSSGDTNKALWDVQLSLHNSPRHIDAMKLKEKILGQRDWASESTSIRHYIMDRINDEAGEPKPPFGRPTAPPFTVPDEIDGPSGVEDDDNYESTKSARTISDASTNSSNESVRPTATISNGRGVIE